MSASYDLIGVGLVAVDILWITPSDARAGEKNNTPHMVLQGGAPAGSGTCGPAMLGYRAGFLAASGTMFSAAPRGMNSPRATCRQICS